MQYKQEDVEQFFLQHECKLLSKYINTKSPLIYIAKCGHTTTCASYEVARRKNFQFMCESCTPFGGYSDDETKDIVEKEGCKLLSIFYERHSNGRSYKTINIKCVCGHEHTLTFEKFMYGRGRICPKCSRPKGEKHHAYNQNLTDEERLKRRDVFENDIWRRNVFERDSYTCRVCKDSKGGNLTAHHLNAWSSYPDQRFDVNNGITLCETCHSKFHKAYGFGNNTVQQFLDWVNKIIPR